MARRFVDVLRNWANGVITSAEPDQIPADASPYGRNSYLASVAPGQAVPQKRRGATTVNATAITGTPEVLGMKDYRRWGGTSYTNYHLIVSDGGRLDKVQSDGTIASADSATPTPFTSGTYYPDMAVANNLLFVANSQDMKKFNGTNVQTWGIATPTSAPTLADSGVAGVHNGTYEARVTYVNTATGHESSAGSTSATVTVTNKQISWSAIPTSADAQVNNRKLYIRNTSTQSKFYLVATISNNTATTATTNVADTALITVGPDTEENNPPVVGQYLAWHLSRMFLLGNLTNPSRLFYSKEGKPESFDPDAFERVNEDDGHRGTALASAFELLVIWKRDAMYGLYGSTPATWQVRLIDPKIGCVSFRTVRMVEGRLYWLSEQGPMVWDGAGPPTPIGLPLILPTVSSSTLNFNQLDIACAEVDLPRQVLLFAVPESGETRNTIVLPYNYRLGRWTSDAWNPFDIATMAVVDDSSSVPWVMMGNYKGQVFKWWNADHDGVDSGTKNGTVTSATSTTLTDTAATFNTTGAGLAQRYIYLYATDAGDATVTRRRIGSNTATALTLDTGLTWPTTPSSGWIYIIGGPDFAWDTYWNDGQLPWYKKRYEFLYVQTKATASGTTVKVDTFFNYYTDAPNTKSASFAATTSDALWDVAVWDTALWGGQGSVNKRLRMGKTGRAWRARVRNRQVDRPLTVLKVGMRGVLLSDKIG